MFVFCQGNTEHLYYLVISQGCQNFTNKHSSDT